MRGTTDWSYLETPAVLDAAARQQVAEERRRDRLSKYLEQIPLHFVDMVLETFPGTSAAQRKALADVTRWAETPELASPWLFLHGPYGTGKTALAIAAARRRMELGHVHRAMFTAVPDLLDRLRATFDRDGPHEREAIVMDALRDSPLLILDDIGSENTTAWASERLFVLLNHRHGDEALTILTSNLDGKGLAARLGERTMWRIAELAQVVSMVGCPNLRARRPQSRLEVVNG